MNVKEEFIEFLHHHPKMRKDRPAPKALYANLMDDDSALTLNIQNMGLKDYKSGYRCLDVKYWENVIKPRYEANFHFASGSHPMVPGTYWNHLAAINKFIEFLHQYKPTR